MDRRLFTPEDKIAPGLYMDYWQAIVRKYGAKHLNMNKFKPYREVRNGAILAAMWTKNTGRKHFVSFPHDKPADVEIYSLRQAVHDGKASYDLVKIPVQLTRCSLASGETLIGQIKKKNKPYLSNTSLVVHMIGEDDVVLDIKNLVKDLRDIVPLYPKEIAVLAPVEDTSVSEQTYAQLLIYHRDETQVCSSRIHTGEKDAFFKIPSVMHSARGTGQAIEHVGEFNLLLP